MGGRNMTIGGALLVLLALVLAHPAGAKEKKTGKPSANQAPAAAAAATVQPLADAGGKVDPNAYVIGPEDHILIRVWREPELSGPVVVRPDGRITLQLLGEVQAAGLAPEALAKMIREGLAAKYMNNPEVTVTVQAVLSKKFYVQGEAVRTGAFPLLVPTTVLEAVVNAGGFRDFAKTTKIFVLRRGKRYPFNYKDVLRGKNMQQNILLENGDIILVP